MCIPGLAKIIRKRVMGKGGASEHLYCRSFDPLAQSWMQAAPGHDVGFAPENSGGRLFHIQQREEPK